MYEWGASFVRVENTNKRTLSVWTALLLKITNITSWKSFEMCDVYNLAEPWVLFTSNPAVRNAYCVDSFTKCNGSFDSRWEHIYARTILFGDYV